MRIERFFIFEEEHKVFFQKSIFHGMKNDQLFYSAHFAPSMNNAYQFKTKAAAQKMLDRFLINQLEITDLTIDEKLPLKMSNLAILPVNIIFDG